MNPILKSLRLIYQGGMWIDRVRRESQSLKRPVVSVGNIAFGGRSKTPFITFLISGLRERGFEPVVLTRGYGRKSKVDTILVPERLELHDFKSNNSPIADICGDEPLEVFHRSEVPVLISKNRRELAKKFLKMAPPLRWLFLLDDGFQHWDLERDFDLVLVTREDQSDRMFPEGRLREGVEALERADLVLEKGSDFLKTTVLKSHPPLGEVLGVLTTRARVDSQYRNFFTEQFDRVHFFELGDHAPASRVQTTLAKNKMIHWVLGLKEAVKILTAGDLMNFMSTGHVAVSRGKLSGLHFYFADFQIQVRDSEGLWSKLLEKVRVRELVG